MVAGSLALEIALVVLLILVNGLFAMAEIAVVSARRSRLEPRAAAGDAGARRALELLDHPNRFLSTVQIGITLVGIFAGAFGGATLAVHLDDALEAVPALAPYSEALSLTIVVAAITYLSLVIGELVPKRIGLTNAERVASRVARPMHVLSIAAGPLVKLLSASTDALLRLLRVRKADEPPVTEEEVAALVRQGAEAGVFEKGERELVEGVFWLGDRRVAELATPRHRIVWLDLKDSVESNRRKIARHRHSRYPVCEGGLDNVLGVVDVRDLYAASVRGDPLDLRRGLRETLFVTESLPALKLLDRFRESGVHFAVVVDEHASVEGVVTLNDLFEEISGDLEPTSRPGVVRREDGSWLADGSLPMAEFLDAMGLAEEADLDGRGYHTLAGFVVARLGRIPSERDAFEVLGFRFEVADMDGHRVDKVLVHPTIPAADGRAA